MTIRLSRNLVSPARPPMSPVCTAKVLVNPHQCHFSVSLMSTLCLLQCTIFMPANTIRGSPSIVYFKNFGHQGNLGTSKLFGTSGSTGTETNKHTIRQSDILRMVPHLKKVINNCGKSGVLDSLIKLTT